MKYRWRIPYDHWLSIVEQGLGWEINLPNLVPMSMNKQLNSHFWVRANEKKIIDNIIEKKFAHIPKATGKRAVQICVVKKTGALDDEPNLDSRSKHIIDSLVTNELLLDDSPKYLEWHHVFQQKAKMSNGVGIRLWVPTNEIVTNYSCFCRNV